MAKPRKQSKMARIAMVDSLNEALVFIPTPALIPSTSHGKVGACLLVLGISRII